MLRGEGSCQWVLRAPGPPGPKGQVICTVEGKVSVPLKCAVVAPSQLRPLSLMAKFDAELRVSWLVVLLHVLPVTETGLEVLPTVMVQPNGAPPPTRMVQTLLPISTLVVLVAVNVHDVLQVQVVVPPKLLVQLLNVGGVEVPLLSTLCATVGFDDDALTYMLTSHVSELPALSVRVIVPVTCSTVFVGLHPVKALAFELTSVAASSATAAAETARWTLVAVI